jgi:HD-GYP domain-containing protein (c-di-GMP phosphodiesterase class II)
MVRMSDLVRGAAAPAPASREEAAPDDPVTTLPAPAAPSAPAPARLSLRAVDTVPQAPAIPRPDPPAPVTALAPTPAREPAAPPAPAGGARGVFDDLQAMLAKVREVVTSRQLLSWPDLEQLVHRVVAALEHSGELFWLANAPSVPAGADYLAVHQSRVAVLAARIGLNVGYDRAHAVALGMAGALIDVGLWQSPDTLLRRPDALTPEEQALYRAHPQRSAALLAQWGAPDLVVDAVLQHHEREQGQGFPQRLAGGAIRHEAKILGLVDAYTALTLPSSRRAGLRPHEAIRDIVRSKHESFSPALIKALLAEISVFPPGTLVRLNTGEVGQVTAVNRNHPLRPRVEIVSDSKGHPRALPKTIDLSETPFLYITGPVSEPTK